MTGLSHAILKYLLNHGFLDLIIPRALLKQALAESLTLYKEAPLKKLGKVPFSHISQSAHREYFVD